MYHPRIVHLCNAKEVAPSKRLISKALIFLFYLFVSWFHNNICIVRVGHVVALVECMASWIVACSI